MGEQWLRLEQVLHRIEGKLSHADGSPAAGGSIRVSYNGTDTARIGIGIFRVALKLPISGFADEASVIRGDTTREYLNTMIEKMIVERSGGKVAFTAQAHDSWYYLELVTSFQPKPH